MRVGHRYLGWGSESDQWIPVMDALKRYQLPFDHLHDPACVISSHQHQIEFTLFEDQPGWQEVKILSDTLDLLCQSAVYYSKADHKAAKHFVLHVPEVLYPQPEAASGYIHASFDSQHYCSSCGMEKTQVGPLRFNQLSRVRKRPVWGVIWEFEMIMMERGTANALLTEGIRHISTVKVIDHKSGDVVPDLLQLKVEHMLPPAFSSERAVQLRCNEPTCGKVKFEHPVLIGYWFDEAKLAHAPDLALSHEYFGSGGHADRLLIVSRSFRALVEKMGLRGLRFTPVLHQ